MLAEHFAAHRIAWSRIVIAGALVLIVFGSPPKYLLGWVAELSELIGFAMLAAATLWRIWCHLFIAGTKDGELASAGPYSVVRNPLYAGNFIGVVGFGFAVERPYLALALAVAFVLLYPAVVAREEARLGELFGERFRWWCRRGMCARQSSTQCGSCGPSACGNSSSNSTHATGVLPTYF